MRAALVRSGSENLTTLGAGAVLTALAARAVRKVLGTAGGVGAGHQGGRDGLPLRTTVTRVATRHLPLRDSHGVLLSWSCSVVLLRVLLVRRQARPPRVDRRLVCVVGVVRQACPA